MFEDFLYFPFPEVEYVSCLEVPVIRRVYKFNCEAKWQRLFILAFLGAKDAEGKRFPVEIEAK